MTLETIKSKGHWVIKIRPTEFKANLVGNITLLQTILLESVVDLRGWDFPHIDFTPGSIKRHQDSIEQDFDWSFFVEYWRFYLSGQFVFVGAMWGDWRERDPQSFLGFDANTKYLFISDTVAKWTEILFFTSKLVRRLNAENVEIEVQLKGLLDRKLYVGQTRLPFYPEKIGTTEQWNDSFSISSSELSENYKKLALEKCRELFRIFGWEASMEVLEGFQKETLKRLS